MKAVDDLIALSVMTRATAIPRRPERLPKTFRWVWRWNGTLAAGMAASTVLHGDSVAVVDDAGRTSYAELWSRTNSLARGLSEAGVEPGTTVGILARNHRGFVEALLACTKLGAHVILLNTSFAGPQLADVVEHEDIAVLVHDDEFADVAAACGPVLALHEQAVAALVAGAPDRELGPPPRPGALIVLTSGTTGRPRGASRQAVGSLLDAGALLERFPLRTGERMVLPTPAFHGWGLVNVTYGLGLAATLVLRRHFDPEETLADVAGERATVLAAVPVMLERILALGGETIVRYDTSSLRILASSGSALPAPLATRLLERFGPVVYNLYGSTEVALATVAGPRDLRDAPGTAGRVVRGAHVRILDADDEDVRVGETGRVFVGNRLRFDGYTGGGGKHSVGGLLSSGDLGHFDRSGRLFIDGREDDMIVSGGENVFPQEVEELLSHEARIAEAAVVGVPDDEFGQRLRAVVVRAPGATLTADDVRELVRGRLARYKVPRDVVFVDALPRTATGKVIRREL